jgi:hypothetical protein
VTRTERSAKGNSLLDLKGLSIFSRGFIYILSVFEIGRKKNLTTP